MTLKMQADAVYVRSYPHKRRKSGHSGRSVSGNSRHGAPARTAKPNAESLDAAKPELTRNWQTWLAHAGLREQRALNPRTTPAGWNQAVARCV
jgi:hypothetical protein